MQYFCFANQCQAGIPIGSWCPSAQIPCDIDSLSLLERQEFKPSVSEKITIVGYFLCTTIALKNPIEAPRVFGVVGGAPPSGDWDPRSNEVLDGSVFSAQLRPNVGRASGVCAAAIQHARYVWLRKHI